MTTGNDDARQRMSFEAFHGVLKTWTSVYKEAAEFATEVGPDRVISVSQSVDGVVVWYWEDDV